MDTNLKDTRYYNMFLTGYQFLRTYINGIPGVGYDLNWIPKAAKTASYYVQFFGYDPFITDLISVCLGEMKEKFKTIAESSAKGTPFSPREYDCNFASSKYSSDFAIFWNLFCKYFPYAKGATQESDEKGNVFWSHLINESGKLGNPKEGEEADRFLQKLLLLCQDEIERHCNQVQEEAA